jgi:hypothetical protein
VQRGRPSPPPNRIRAVGALPDLILARRLPEATAPGARPFVRATKWEAIRWRFGEPAARERRRTCLRGPLPADCAHRSTDRRPLRATLTATAILGPGPDGLVLGLLEGGAW